MWRAPGRGFATFLALACLSCSPDVDPPASSTVTSERADSAAAQSTYSNIRREDYVGPEKCGECHPQNYKAWKQHPHSRMNALATDETVVGDFSGAVFSYGNGSARFSRDNGDFIVEYFREKKRIRRFRVTRTIGWRYE